MNLKDKKVNWNKIIALILDEDVHKVKKFFDIAIQNMEKKENHKLKKDEQAKTKTNKARVR